MKTYMGLPKSRVASKNIYRSKRRKIPSNSYVEKWDIVHIQCTFCIGHTDFEIINQKFETRRKWTTRKT
jgi:hypothetical protein